MIYETFREAIQNIWSNKFRTLLTMLGIIIGVMAGGKKLGCPRGCFALHQYERNGESRYGR